MRTAARDSLRRQATDAEFSADRADIVGAIGDSTPRLRRGLPVAWSVVADQPQSALGGIPHIPAVQVPGIWRAHVDQDRPTRGITVVFDRQRPAVPGVNCALHVASLELRRIGPAGQPSLRRGFTGLNTVLSWHWRAAGAMLAAASTGVETVHASPEADLSTTS